MLFFLQYFGECTTYSTELHSSQVHETYSWQTIHEEKGLKFDPHPLHDPLLYILLDMLTYCIKAPLRRYAY